MRRFVFIPGALIFFGLWLAVFQVMASRATQEPRQIPQPPDRLIPGQAAPQGMACNYYVPDFSNLYCETGEDVSVVVVKGQIKTTELFTWYSGLTVGDLIIDWGDPVAATYESGAVSMFWENKAAYVLTAHSFTPQSRVGFLEFGEVTRPRWAWRGFTKWSRSQ